MNLTKRVPYRNKNILQAAEGEACTMCGEQNGTTVFAHLDESFAGKGRGQKSDDCAGMFLCYECHQGYGEYKSFDNWQILRAYYRTIRRLFDKGVIK